jgi:hypothetical protein
MIYDEDNRELLYWPITGLVEGQASEHIIIGVDTPQDRKLTVTDDSRLRVWARLEGTADAFVDLAEDPIDLLGLPAGRTQFEIYCEATSPMEGLERVALSLSESGSMLAGWSH